MNKAYRSAQGQDRWLNDNVFKGLRNGFFIEMGALDGVTNSNSYFFEKTLSWSGVLIEPNEASYNLIKNHRTSLAINKCVYNGDFVSFFEKKGHSGIVDKNLDNCLSKKEISLSNKIKSITILDALLISKSPKTIEYFSLDVEGAEEEIIKSFPFEDYLVKAFTIERATDEIYDILYRENYCLVRKKWPDHYFLHKTIAKEVNLNPISFSEFKIKKLKNGKIIQA